MFSRPPRSRNLPRRPFEVTRSQLDAVTNPGHAGRIDPGDVQACRTGCLNWHSNSRMPQAARGSSLDQRSDNADLSGCHAKYAPDLDATDRGCQSGYYNAAAVSKIFELCGDNLTRENVLYQMTHLHGLTVPMFLPGITLNTTWTITPRSSKCSCNGSTEPAG
jgi:hypothetical protein